MLQEKASAVTDGCMSRVQAGSEGDLLSDQPRPDPTTAPTIPSSSEPDQVQTRVRARLKHAVCRLTWRQLLRVRTNESETLSTQTADDAHLKRHEALPHF